MQEARSFGHVRGSAVIGLDDGVASADGRAVAPVAQLVEQRAASAQVAGSSPARRFPDSVFDALFLALVPLRVYCDACGAFRPVSLDSEGRSRDIVCAGRHVIATLEAGL